MLSLERSEVQRVRERAYFLWQDDGCLDGFAEEYWFEAMRIERALRTIQAQRTQSGRTMDAASQAMLAAARSLMSGQATAPKSLP